MASSSNAPPGAIAPPDYTDDDAKALFHPSTNVHPPAYIQPVRLPLCLPQINTGIDSPFARAYAPHLAESGIDMNDWLKFLDGLNTAFIASPPLRVIDAAGMIIGLVPYHWAIIAGVVMQTAAQTTAHVLSKTLTDRYLREANENFFAPRGLRVRLCKTSAMRQLIGIDPIPTQPPSKAMETAKAVGRGVESVGLRLPIVRKIITRIHPPTAPVDERMGADFPSRRLATVQGYTLPLDFNVPPPRMPSGMVNKVQSLGVKLGQWQSARANAKASHARQILALRRGGSDATGLAYQFGGDGRKARKAGRRAERDERRGRVPRESRKLRMKVAIADRKEETAASGILWLVVLNEEQDNLIQGREVIDSKADCEEISESEWEDEIELENEIDGQVLDEKDHDVKAF